MNKQMILAVTITLFGCTAAQYSDRRNEVIEVPESFIHEGGAQVRVGFCSDFQTPELDELLKSALTNNLDLMASYARLEQARAISRLNNATLYPNISADFSAGRSKNAAPPPKNTIETNAFRASLGAGYELDLWGKLHHNRLAAEKTVEASQADFETMNISIATQTTLSFFDLVAQREKKKLLEAQIDISTRFLELTTMRFRQGRASALDLTQQRQQLESLKGRLTMIEASEKTALSQLALLTGTTSKKFLPLKTSKMPDIPELPAIGIPADLLENRPDLRAALLRLEAMDHKSKAAASEMLPSIRLSANVFLQAANIEDLVEDIFWSITGALSQKLFTGGRVSAQVAQAEAAARAAVYAFGQLYLRALKEVEDALIMEDAQVKFLSSLDKQIADATLGLDIARDRYQTGVGDYLRVLSILQNVQQLEQSRVDGKRQRANFRVSLCRALGGDWVKNKTIKEKLIQEK